MMLGNQGFLTQRSVSQNSRGGSARPRKKATGGQTSAREIKVTEEEDCGANNRRRQGNNHVTEPCLKYSWKNVKNDRLDERPRTRRERACMGVNTRENAVVLVNVSDAVVFC